MTSVTTSRVPIDLATLALPEPTASRRDPMGTRRPVGRDTLLDLLRGIALVRVVIWHTFSSHWMTAFAAMPVMFFVVGTMLPDVRTWSSYVHAVRRRGQRVLVPYWAYGAVIWAAAGIYALTGADRPTLPVPHWSALNWLVPLDDPTGATFHGGWLSSHLWYLRAYIWVILGIPILGLAARRIRMGVGVFLAAVVGLEIAGRQSWGILGSGTARVLVGDFVIYGFFVVLGIWFANRRRSGAAPLSSKISGVVAVASAAGAVAFWQIAGLPGHEVNNSYPALVLTGLAWLAATQAAEAPLRRLADRPAVARRSQALSGRALTVYLWHPAAIVVAHKIVRGSGPLWVLGTLGAVAAGTWACVGAFGWLEDRARPASAAGANANAAGVKANADAAPPPTVTRRARIGRLVALRSHRLVVPVAGLLVVAVSVSQLRNDSAAAAHGGTVTATAGLAPSYREALKNDAFPKLAAPPEAGDDTASSANADVASSATVAAIDGPPIPAVATDPGAAPSSILPAAPSDPGVSSASPGANPSGSAPVTTTPTTPTPGSPGATTATTAPPATVRPVATPSAKSTSAKKALWTSTEFQGLLDDWLNDNPTVGSVTASVVVDGQIWTGEAHQGGAVSFHAADRYSVLSITKTFTAALVLQAVDRGEIRLDEEMPALDGVDAPAEAVTVRELLTHTSGLVDYTESPKYRPDQPITPVEAVNLSTHEPFRTAPGVEVHYANTNFLYLELLLEQRTGRPFADLMAELVGSLGLKSTTLEPPDHPGWAASGSGGIYSTVTDLAEWTDALFTHGRVLSAESVHLMTTLDEHNIGLGTWPICPCWTDNNDAKRYTAIGHHFGSGAMEFYPATGISVAARIDPTSDAAGGQAAEIGVRYSNLIARLRRAAGRK